MRLIRYREYHWEILIHPCRSLGTLAWLLAHWEGNPWKSVSFVIKSITLWFMIWIKGSIVYTGQPDAGEFDTKAYFEILALHLACCNSCRTGQDSVQEPLQCCMVLELWWSRVWISHSLLNHNCGLTTHQRLCHRTDCDCSEADRGSRQRQTSPLHGWEAEAQRYWPEISQGFCIELRAELRSLGSLPSAIHANQAAAIGTSLRIIWWSVTDFSGQREQALGVHDSMVLSDYIEHRLIETSHPTL